MPLTQTQSDALIGAIRDVAQTEILPRFRNLPNDAIDAKSTFDDLVTIADRAAEVAMTRRFQAILPGDAVIGEEAISEGSASLTSVSSGRCVVIDPIDGTWNFAHGLATYGVIVAVVEDGETVWGCLYDPGFDDWVHAATGQGCHFVRGGRSRRLTTLPDAAPFETMRGNTSDYLFPQDKRPALAKLTPCFRRQSSLGASLQEYRAMCLGGRDFCLNGMLNVWDHAAGVLCLNEAGGCSRLLDGRAYRPSFSNAEAQAGGYLLNARSPAVWDDLASLFTDALA